jgi:NitT/TauT family transport system substrate-binding protein
VPEVRVARLYSLGYLQLNVIQHEKLIQKYAAKLGIPAVKVTAFRLNGPTPMNDALLSGSIDVASGSPEDLLAIWSRTRGSDNEVRAISALATQPYALNTNDPEIRTIDDLGRCRNIAVPGDGDSAQAVTLRAAVAAAYGIREFGRYDSLVVPMSPPDSTVALLSNTADIGCSFAVSPYLQQQLERPWIHAVLNSFDVWGGPNTFTVAYASSRFRTTNPLLFRAVYAALREATERVNTDPETAAGYWIVDGESKLPVKFVKAVATAPGTVWTMAPQSTMTIAAFMYDIGSIEVKPESWKDYFFPDAHDLDGS